MSAQYQGAGLVPEYIIMYYTAHLHTPSLWQMQHNSAQPSFTEDSCICCVLRHVYSALLGSLTSSFASNGELETLAQESLQWLLPMKGVYFLSSLPYYDHITANVIPILL